MANETDNFIKSSIGWLELVNYSTAPVDGDPNRRGLCFVGGVLKYWNGTTMTTVSGSGGASTWDEVYDNDKTLTVDDGTMTFLLPTLETHALITLQAQSGATGATLAFSNAGTGNDVTGTSSTWEITKAGAGTLASLIAESVTAAANLTLEATGAGTIGIGATSSGTITLGAGGGSVVVTNGLTITGTADANKLTITAGDLLMSNGKVAITNDDVDAIATLTANAVTTGNAVLLTANGVTSGNLVSLVTTSAGFTGKFISLNDGSVRFSVGVDGATLIASGVNSTKALEVTGIQTAENLVTLTSTGVTASDKAIVLINSSGNSASGSNQVRIAPSGIPVEGSIGIEFVGAGKLMKALYIDGDSATNSVAQIHGGGALNADKAVLELTSDGTLANGASILRIASATAAGGATAYGLEISCDAANLEALWVSAGTSKFAETVDIDGSLTVAGITTYDGTPQTLTGAGAVNVTTSITWIVTNAANALTLADGAEGQRKFIVMKTDDGAGTLTPTSLGNGSTIVFDDVGDCADLIFTNAAWHMIGGTATLA